MRGNPLATKMERNHKRSEAFRGSYEQEIFDGDICQVNAFGQMSPFQFVHQTDYKWRNDKLQS